MTTMDMTKLFGGSPANFLDIGGGAKAETVAAALRIILADPNVKAVLFNIFGGITRCDEVALGILAALKEVKADLPMVVRLVGTNEEEGRRLLDEAKLPNMITAQHAGRGRAKSRRRCAECLSTNRTNRGSKMAILVDKHTKLIVQGITGREGLFHTEQMIEYGTNVVGGVTPGKGGEWALGKPVFRYRQDGERVHRGEHDHYLCSGGVCGRCDLRSG